MVEAKPRGRAKRWVPRKGQFLLRREDAHGHAADAILMRIIGREDERGLGKVRLTSDSLHLEVGESSAIMDDGKRVALQGAFGEDVQHGIGKRGGHGSSLASGSFEAELTDSCRFRTLPSPQRG